LKKKKNKGKRIIIILIIILLVLGLFFLFNTMKDCCIEKEKIQEISPPASFSPPPPVLPSPPPPPPPPPSVVQNPIVRTDNGTDVQQTSIRLRGFLEPHGRGEWWFELGVSASSLRRQGQEVPVSRTQDVDLLVSELSPGTEYFFRLVFRRDGRVFHGNVRSFMTDISPSPPPVLPSPPPPPPPPPSVVQNPIVRTDNGTDVQQTSIRLRGFLEPHGRGEWWFELGVSASSLRRQGQEVPVSRTQDVDLLVSELSPGTEYFFRLVFRRDGRVFHGNVRSFMTDFP